MIQSYTQDLTSIGKAIRELRREAWDVAEEPGPIRSSFEELSELDRFGPWGYRLMRAIQ